MQALAFLAVLMIVAGNVVFFVLPILFAVVGAIAEEIVNLYVWVSGGVTRTVHGHA